MVFVNEETMAITMTRGDTAELQIGCLIDDTEYVPQEGDVVTFAVKHQTQKGDKYKEYEDQTAVCQITVPNDTLILEIQPSDTRPLEFGTYDYQVDIEFADGKVNTFIESTLKITKEVHKDGN